jgi:hypothetical protein
MYEIVFPKDTLYPRKVDSAYELEFEAFSSLGHTVNLIDVDTLPASVTRLPNGAPILYRGWMLTPETYKNLDRCLNHKLLTSPSAYVSSHHLPQWYSTLSHLTMQSQWVPPDIAVATFLDWQARGHERVFLKDYVKSINTHQGSVASSANDVERILSDLSTYRSDIEGGVVLREFVDLVAASETRGFVLHGKLHLPHDNVPLPLISLMEEVAQLHTTSHFYSVDAAFTATGRPILIEIGDGQVSGTRGWTLEKFVSLFCCKEPGDSRHQTI